MFDSGVLIGLDGPAAAGLVAESFELLVRSELRLLRLAAVWADLHGWDEDVEPAGVRPAGAERARRIGGPGTPWVLEFAAAELGALQGTTTTAACGLMADAVDLRDRLPRLWGRVVDGGVRVWKARKVAQATRHLSVEGSAAVDAAVTPYIASLPWARFQVLLDAKIVEADPAGAEAQARIWELDRFVRAGRSRRHGLRLLVARANAGDVVWFMAMVNRIAEVLLVEGDGSSVGVRRSKAIGILAQPAVALELLTRHQSDVDSRDLDEPGVRARLAGDEGDVEPSTHTSVRFATAPGDSRAGGPDDLGDDSGDSVWDDPYDSNDPYDPDDTYDPDDVGGPVVGSGSGPGRSGRRGSLLDRWGGLSRVVVSGFGGCCCSRGVSSAELVRARPRAVLYVHLSEESFRRDGAGVARFEGVGPVTVEQARRFLGESCSVRVQPVIDAADVAPADSYEIPTRLREAVRLRNPADVFPWGTSTSRGLDLDHTIPFLRAGREAPPGQTSLANLGPLSRHHHRVKTHARWGLRQPIPGSYLWRSPTGYVFWVTAGGTQPLGRKGFAQDIWRAGAETGKPEVTPAS